MREEEDPRWPTSIAELSHGMKSPPMDEFYEAQSVQRRASAVARFTASPELAALGVTEPRWIAQFLDAADCLSIDPDQIPVDIVDTWLSEMLANPIRCKPAELPDLIAEMVAYFRFSARVLEPEAEARLGHVCGDAEACAELLSSGDLNDDLARAIAQRPRQSRIRSKQKKRGLHRRPPPPRMVTSAIIRR
jgi:hypothetical protein